MRNSLMIVLAVFLTSVLTGAVAKHCVPVLAAVAPAAHVHDHDSHGVMTHEDCVIADAQSQPGPLPGLSVPGPGLKPVAILVPDAAIPPWTSQDRHAQAAHAMPARASPAYAEAFARTGRLLI